MLAPAQAALVNVGGVEAHARSHVRVHGGAERQMSADADAHDPQIARAGRVRFQEVEDRAGVGVVTGKLLRDLVRVALLGAGGIVGQHRARRDQFVVNLRHRDHEAVSASRAAVRRMGPVTWKISE